MRKLSDYIAELQQKPLHIRMRVLWATTAVVAVLLVALWGITLKSELNHLGGNTPAPQPIPQTAVKYIFVERAETTKNSFLLYFRINNDTSDILNFSKLTDIKLTANGNSINPSKITDRQGQNFVQKILSHSENFGIMIFPLNSAADGSIVFDNLYFESHPETSFKETLNLNFEELNKPQELRN